MKKSLVLRLVFEVSHLPCTCFQFWSVFVQCSTQYSDSVRVTLDQFDTVKRFVDKYDDDFMFVTKSYGRSSYTFKVIVIKDHAPSMREGKVFEGVCPHGAGLEVRPVMVLAGRGGSSTSCPDPAERGRVS